MRAGRRAASSSSAAGRGGGGGWLPSGSDQDDAPEPAAKKYVHPVRGSTARDQPGVRRQPPVARAYPGRTHVRSPVAGREK